MTITTIRDTLRAFAQSLQVSFSFPAALFVVMNLYFILPKFFRIDMDAVSTFSMTVSAALLLSYLLFAFNFPIIRFLEGYKCRGADWNVWLATQQRSAYNRAYTDFVSVEESRRALGEMLSFNPADAPDILNRKSLTEAERKNYRKWLEYTYQSNLIRSRLEQTFPSNPAAILATSLGNSIAAFEDYPRARYGMDSIALWPRLLPILRDTKYHEFVAQEKMTFDFLLNMLVVTFILSFEFVYSFLFVNELGWAVWAAVFSFVFIFVLYSGLVVAARQWGTTVRVAFDLFRQELFHKLQLRPVNSPQEEFIRWQEVSRFIAFRQKTYNRGTYLHVDEL